MTAMERRLGEVEPRERTGARTGRMYEYQYERTARATLDLLADSTKHICVYCDWHDDYVIEIGDPPTRYLFHQVKGRKSSARQRRPSRCSPSAVCLAWSGPERGRSGRS